MSGRYPAFEPHDPLFVIGRPLAFELLDFLHCRDLMLTDHDSFPTLFFAARHAKHQNQCQDTHWYTRS